MPDKDLARELEVAANGVLDACQEEYSDLPPVVKQAVDDWRAASEAFAQGQRAHGPSDRPTDVDGPDNRPTLPAGQEPEETGRPASLPGGELPNYIDVLASHIRPENREFTVRVYRCDHRDRRDPHEALAKTYETEAKARDFYARTQNIWNMRARSGEAPGYDVVLGVQDRRKHAKKASYREWEHALCKGGPA